MRSATSKSSVFFQMWCAFLPYEIVRAKVWYFSPKLWEPNCLRFVAWDSIIRHRDILQRRWCLYANNRLGRMGRCMGEYTIFCQMGCSWISNTNSKHLIWTELLICWRHPKQFRMVQHCWHTNNSPKFTSFIKCPKSHFGLERQQLQAPSLYQLTTYNIMLFAAGL